jgi:hemoglobin
LFLQPANLAAPASWDVSKLAQQEKAEVLAAFAAHKDEVTAGYVAAAKRG